MALKDKVKFEMLVDPDDPTVLVLRPIDAQLEDDSIYSIPVKNITFADGTSYSDKHQFITTITNNNFIDVEDVKEMVGGLDIGDENILKHIIESSKTAVYWAKRNLEPGESIPDFTSETFQEDYYPFYMFIKHHAIVESLKEFYIELISNPKKWHDVLSDLEREEEMDFDAIKKLIDDYSKEADEWLAQVVTITADPKWALRGKYSYSVYNHLSEPYHNIGWGYPRHNNFNRDY